MKKKKSKPKEKKESHLVRAEMDRGNQQCGVAKGYGFIFGVSRQPQQSNKKSNFRHHSLLSTVIKTPHEEILFRKVVLFQMAFQRLKIFANAVLAALGRYPQLILKFHSCHAVPFLVLTCCQF